MLEDLQLRNYASHTIACYLRCVADFARRFGVSPAHLGPEQVRTYQLFLVQEKQVVWPGGRLSGCGTWEGMRFHAPHLHDPDIPQER
jgi:Phage integrase, N-terminal SAM-like domain